MNSVLREALTALVCCLAQWTGAGRHTLAHCNPTICGFEFLCLWRMCAHRVLGGWHNLCVCVCLGRASACWGGLHCAVSPALLLVFQFFVVVFFLWRQDLTKLPGLAFSSFYGPSCLPFWHLLASAYWVAEAVTGTPDWHEGLVLTGGLGCILIKHWDSDPGLWYWHNGWLNNLPPKHQTCQSKVRGDKFAEAMA